MTTQEGPAVPLGAGMNTVAAEPPSPYNNEQARLALRKLLDDALTRLPILGPLTGRAEHSSSPRPGCDTDS
ncbi:hypothetical protein [Streptomyces sp. NPDC005568]|uniref:hypothetical protein n=1 Tax=Streptomyces sp. NPDC005568 TaxID=3156887 RepID=UPI0033B371ED